MTESDDDGEPTDRLRAILESPRLLDDPGGARSWLEDRGVTISLYYNNFTGANLRGGKSTNDGLKNSGSGDYFLHLDFGTMGVLPGGESLVQAKSNHGKNINPDVGALSDPFDDADFDEAFYLDQVWYQQNLFGDRVRLRLGYLDQQTILDRNAYANSEDKQFMSTLLDNNNAIVPLQIGLGATLWLKPTDWLELILGTADADNKILVAGFDTAFDDFESLYSYLEADFKVELQTSRGPLPGTYRVGTFYDPKAARVFGRTNPSTGQPVLDRGHVGVYLSFDQLIFRETEDDSQGLGAFVRYGYRDERVRLIAHVWSTGLQYEGLLPGRDGDTLGVALYQAILSDRFNGRVNPAADMETGVEVYYRVPLTPWFAVTPDFQFIDNPGGLATGRDAVVLGLRLRLTF